MSLQEESQLLSVEDDDMSLMSPLEEKIQQAVKNNDIDTLTEMITSGVDVNDAVVINEFGVSGI